jgi:hypothetical protein
MLEEQSDTDWKISGLQASNHSASFPIINLRAAFAQAGNLQLTVKSGKGIRGSEPNERHPMVDFESHRLTFNALIQCRWNFELRINQIH